jgi:hypothetical protein
VPYGKYTQLYKSEKKIKYISNVLCTLNVKFQFIYWHTNHDSHSTNQQYELPVVAMFVNGSGRNEQSL